MSDFFEHLSPGDRWKPSAFEVNAMKDVARAYQGGQAVAPSLQLGGFGINSVCVRVRNQTGAAIDRYTCFSLGEPRWIIDATQRISDLIWSLDSYSTSKPAAIALEPMAVNQFGLACVSGPCLCKVTNGGTTSDRLANPNSSGVLVPGSGQINLAHSRPAAGGVVLVILGFGSPGIRLRMFRTPTGGIPAATSAVPGSAICTEFPNGIGGTAGGTATVFNHRTNIIPQNVFILATTFTTASGIERLYVIEPNCPAGIVNPNPDPGDEQGGGGTP